LHCHACRPPRSTEPVEDRDQLLERLLAASSVTLLQRQVLVAVAAHAEAVGVSLRTTETVLQRLLQVVVDGQQDGLPDGQLVALTAVTAAVRNPVWVRFVRDVLAEHELLREDTTPTIHAWIDRVTDGLPGFGEEVRAWLVELHDGAARARPHSVATLYAYFGRVRPHLVTWSRTRGHLREVTAADVVEVLDGLRGHARAGTFTSLRSLFRFARRRRLVFVDPTRRLHVGRAPQRSVLPLTEAQVAAIERAAVTPAQRLVVALIAVHAARPATIRHLLVDDIDLATRRIALAGRAHRLVQLLHTVLVEWLYERHRRWPHTPNRHLLVSNATAAGTAPVSDFYLAWHLSDVPLEHLRADRVLHEALAVDADPLHLAAAFGLSTQTAIDYAGLARALISRPIEDHPLDAGR
jgi:hypothetical protein